MLLKGSQVAFVEKCQFSESFFECFCGFLFPPSETNNMGNYQCSEQCLATCKQLEEKLHQGFAAVCRCVILPQHVASLTVSPTNDQEVWIHRLPMGRQLPPHAIPLRASVELRRWLWSRLNELPICYIVPAWWLSPPKARPTNLFLPECQAVCNGDTGDQKHWGLLTDRGRRITKRAQPTPETKQFSFVRLQRGLYETWTNTLTPILLLEAARPLNFWSSIKQKRTYSEEVSTVF